MVAEHPITITDDTVTIRIGIDHTRSITDIGAAILDAVRTHTGDDPRAALRQVNIEIATIR